jgi:hypothetical protein
MLYTNTTALYVYVAHFFWYLEYTKTVRLYTYLPYFFGYLNQEDR